MTPPAAIALATLATDARVAEAIRFHEVVHGADAEWESLLRHHPRWSAQGTHRAVTVDGNLASMASVARWEQRFGDTTLPVGEVGLVGTLPIFRRRGYCAALMRTWFDILRADGVPLVFLFGIPDFYEQFDFAYAAPNTSPARLWMPRRALETIPAPAATRLRALDPDRDLPAVAALESAASAGSPCATIRDMPLWRYALTHAAASGASWLVAENAAGDLTGIARFAAENAGVAAWTPPGALSFAAARDVDAARAIAAEALRRLVGRGTEDVPLAVAPHQWLGRWFHAHGAGAVIDSRIVPGTWAAMYRVLDLARVLEAWRPVHERALADAAPFARLAVTLRASRDTDGVATLAVDGQRVSITPGPGGHDIGAPIATVVPWLTGWRAFEDPFTFEPEPWRDALPPEAVRLLRTLFPTRHPWIGDLFA